MSRYKSITPRQKAERSYPYRVDIDVPDGGLQGRYKAMREWCAHHCGPWDQHGLVCTSGDRPSRPVSRFYFADIIEAESFHAEFGGQLTTGSWRQTGQSLR